MFSKSVPIITLILCFGIFTTLSCNQTPKTKAGSESWDKKNTRDLNPNDTSYLLAVKTAKDNIDFFIKLVKGKRENRFSFYIKSKFKEDDHVEHMWSVVRSLNDTVFLVSLDNVPNYLTRVKYKDNLKISKGEVEDWIVYQKDSILFGNFIKTSTLK